jgi:hypothetical protein
LAGRRTTAGFHCPGRPRGPRTRSAGRALAPDGPRTTARRLWRPTISPLALTHLAADDR